VGLGEESGMGVGRWYGGVGGVKFSNCSYPACQDLLISSNKHRTKISNPLKIYQTSTNLSRTRLSGIILTPACHSTYYLS
jgi:hypothetical protein